MHKAYYLLHTLTIIYQYKNMPDWVVYKSGGIINTNFPDTWPHLHNTHCLPAAISPKKKIANFFDIMHIYFSHYCNKISMLYQISIWSLTDVQSIWGTRIWLPQKIISWGQYNQVEVQDCNTGKNLLRIIIGGWPSFHFCMGARSERMPLL